MAAELIGRRVRVVEILEPDAFAHCQSMLGVTGHFTEITHPYSPEEFSGEFVLDESCVPPDHSTKTCFHRVRIELVQEAAPEALAAVRAAKNAHRWGYYTARRYAEKRGATPLMWFLALRVECDRTARKWELKYAGRIEQLMEVLDGQA